MTEEIYAKAKQLKIFLKVLSYLSQEDAFMKKLKAEEKASLISIALEIAEFLEEILAT